MFTRLTAAAARTSSQDESRKRHHTGPPGTPPASPPSSSPSDTDMSGPTGRSWPDCSVSPRAAGPTARWPPSLDG